MADVGTSAASSSAGLIDLAGSNEKNAERDCHRVMVKKFKLALPIHQSTLDVGHNATPSVPLLKLRDWTKYLVESNHTHLLVGLKEPCWDREGAILRQFWNFFRKQEPNHPIFHEAAAGNLELCRCFPMLLHGDEGRGRKRTAFLVLNFHGVLGHGLKVESNRKGLKVKNPKRRRRTRVWTRMRPNYSGHSYTSRFLFAALPKSLYTGEN